MFVKKKYIFSALAAVSVSGAIYWNKDIDLEVYEYEAEMFQCIKSYESDVKFKDKVRQITAIYKTHLEIYDHAYLGEIEATNSENSSQKDIKVIYSTFEILKKKCADSLERAGFDKPSLSNDEQQNHWFSGYNFSLIN